MPLVDNTHCWWPHCLRLHHWLSHCWQYPLSVALLSRTLLPMDISSTDPLSMIPSLWTPLFVDPILSNVIVSYGLHLSTYCPWPYYLQRSHRRSPVVGNTYFPRPNRQQRGLSVSPTVVTPSSMTLAMPIVRSRIVRRPIVLRPIVRGPIVRGFIIRGPVA